MIPSEVSRGALALPEDERLELARQLIKSVGIEEDTQALIVEGVGRIEDIACGRVAPLDEQRFRAALR